MGKRNSSPQKVPLLVASPVPESNPNALIQKGTYFVNATGWSVDPKTDEVYLNVIRNGQEVSVPFSELKDIKDPTVFHPFEYAHFISALYDPEVTALIKAGQITCIDLVKEVNRVKSMTTEKEEVVTPDYIGLKIRRETNVGAYATNNNKIYLNLNSSNFPKSVYILKSMLRHELLHLTEKARYKIDPETNKKVRDYTYGEHMRVYLRQMKYPEFLDCTEDFQKTMVKKFCERFLSYVFVDRPSKVEDVNKYLDEFNRHFGSGCTNSKGDVIKINIDPVLGGSLDDFGLNHLIYTYNRKNKEEKKGISERYPVYYDSSFKPSN